MSPDLHNVSVLAKTQLYILKNYSAPHNEPWCYHTQFSYHLKVQNLSMPMFHKAVSSVLERHPVLKTVLVLDDEENVYQATKSSLKLQIRYEDISGLFPESQQEWISRFLLEDRNSPFDVHNQNLPLFRCYIIKRSNNTLQFVLVFNHAIWDGWSLAILLKEIFAHYQLLKEKPILKLEPAEYEYSDFIKIEQEVSQSSDGKAFWKDHLKHHQPYTPECKEIQIVYNDYRPVERLLAPDLAARLVKLQQQQRVTMKSIFIAQYIRMVAEETQQQYSTIGIVTNGRSVQLKNPLSTLGLLWNLAPLCIENNDDLLQNLKNVHKALAETAVHGAYPLIDILEEHKTDALFHAAFNFINFEGANLLPPGGDIEFLEVGGLDKFHFPLHLLVGKNPFNKDISLVLNYDTRCYSEQEAEDMMDKYVAGLQRLNE